MKTRIIDEIKDYGLLACVGMSCYMLFKIFWLACQGKLGLWISPGMETTTWWISWKEFLVDILFKF